MSFTEVELPYHRPTTPAELTYLQSIGQYDPNCAGCEERRQDVHAFMPSHQPSALCRSGKRNHCTCDTCF